MRRKLLVFKRKLVRTALMSKVIISVLLLGHLTITTKHDKSYAHHLRCRTSLLVLTSCQTKLGVLTPFKTAQHAKPYLLPSTQMMRVGLKRANSGTPPVPTLLPINSLAMKNLKTFLDGITRSQGISSIGLWDNWQPRQLLETVQKMLRLPENSVSPKEALMSS